MRWPGLLLLAACRFSNSIGADGAPPDDAMIDAPPDAPPDAFDEKCFGSGSFYLCLPALPSGAVSLGGQTIDTTPCDNNTEMELMLGTTPICVVAAQTITLNSTQTLFVTGDKPLVLVAVDALTIGGAIDASSVGTNLGPGANAAACDSAGIDGAMDLDGGSGGAGGTFGSRGGNGGNGDQDGVPVAGAVATTVPPKSTILRGGCPGGRGGAGTALVAASGPGGGAIYLVSRGALTISGIIDANGGGGAGGRQARGGGGGGGSGGMIVLHAATLTIGTNARIAANGGGGGGGAGTNADGDPGESPNPVNLATPARGGQATMSGRSQGGDGAAAAANATPGMNGNNGGGGGGGGHGLIRVIAPANPTFPSGTVSPAPVP